jgi:hypothetical protein
LEKHGIESSHLRLGFFSRRQIAGPAPWEPVETKINLAEGDETDRAIVLKYAPLEERLMVTLEELRQLCDYVGRRIVPSTDDGLHCDGTTRHAKDYLETLGESARLSEYIKTGQARCDCLFLMQFPGVFSEGTEDACEGCGEPMPLTWEMIHGPEVIQ